MIVLTISFICHIDIFDKCELDCAMDNATDQTAVTTCQKACSKSKASCVDSDETIACYNCTVACAITYNNAMKVCLLEVPRTMTFTKDYSSCEKAASDAMSTCMKTCSPHAV